MDKYTNTIRAYGLRGTLQPGANPMPNTLNPKSSYNFYIYFITRSFINLLVFFLFLLHIILLLLCSHSKHSLNGLNSIWDGVLDFTCYCHLFLFLITMFFFLSVLCCCVRQSRRCRCYWTKLDFVAAENNILILMNVIIIHKILHRRHART